VPVAEPQVAEQITVHGAYNECDMAAPLFAMLLRKVVSCDAEKLLRTPVMFGQS
jgi:hypothetical protein